MLVRGDQDFFGLLTALLEHVSTCSPTADPAVGYHYCSCASEYSWIDGCPEVLTRLEGPFLLSPCRPESTVVLLTDIEALSTIQAALEYCGDCVIDGVIGGRQAVRDIFEGVERELFQLIEETDWYTRSGTGDQPVCSSEPRNASS